MAASIWNMLPKEIQLSEMLINAYKIKQAETWGKYFTWSTFSELVLFCVLVVSIPVMLGSYHNIIVPYSL